MDLLVDRHDNPARDAIFHLAEFVVQNGAAALGLLPPGNGAADIDMRRRHAAMWACKRMRSW
ncbi:hypothetical protein EN766_00905 [Mesorhizobium sp. M2A.F.Ca.ET.046.02.1.1]|uniref:hypothetical protein n=1 Tax=Mesorhizobium sp. TaxID=1871066 RepID=UPI000FD49681|nr:hypothetical protein [Mesorhizobium sp.]RVC82514.1 hypothetical protein EN766_00905 [Mesorhizobium sp. M2A.F.Ca.ET.046.02.1.1]